MMEDYIVIIYLIAQTVFNFFVVCNMHTQTQINETIHKILKRYDNGR